LVSKIDNTNKKKIDKNEIIPIVTSSLAKIIVTIGAGDLGELVPQIKQSLL
jgi:UDP-N-acetylmuramate--alanine ligase